jgi:hypothetical protein
LSTPKRDESLHKEIEQDILYKYVKEKKMLQETCIGKNSCCHYELSDIKTTQNGLIYFPKYFLEDYYIDYFEQKSIPYTTLKKKYLCRLKKHYLGRFIFNQDRIL